VKIESGEVCSSQVSGQAGADKKQRMLTVVTSEQDVRPPKLVRESCLVFQEHRSRSRDLGEALALVAEVRESGASPLDVKLDLLLGTQCEEGWFGWKVSAAPPAHQRPCSCRCQGH
jgi:hypothetical protein